MTTQPEALRLADELSTSHLNHYLNHAAAFELRRLHEVEKQRDELLAALRDLMADNSDLSMTQHLALYRKARAAINKAERTTT